MDISVKTENPAKGAALLMVEGEVDLNSSPDLRKAMAAHLNKKSKALIVELSKVGYMDSSGIATLVEAMKLSQKFKIKFRLAALSGPVKEVFKMAHLENVFDVCEKVEDALADL